jgi:hypothetical protein
MRNWYPPELGVPASSGSQNNFRYAFFPATRRLAIELDGHLSVFDTEDHSIGGVSQQQETGGGRVTFTSQHGTVDLARLRRWLDTLATERDVPGPGARTRRDELDPRRLERETDGGAERRFGK